MPAYTATQQQATELMYQSSTLFNTFVSFLERHGIEYRATHKSFGQRLTALTKGEHAMPGVDKYNDTRGIVYNFRVETVCAEMARRMWVDPESLVRTSALRMVEGDDDGDVLGD